MKVIRIIGRSITNAGKSIARNFSLSMASITCTIITLILVSLGVLVSYNVNNITKDIEKEFIVYIWISIEDVTDDNISSISTSTYSGTISMSAEGR